MSGLRVNVVPNAPTNIAVVPGFDFFISPSGSDSNSGSLLAPWALTALNTKRATYTGKKVGILDAPYDVSTSPATANSVKLWIASGSPGSPTIVQSVNPRGASISHNTATPGYVSAPIIGDGANGVGLNGTPHDITIKDLEFSGGDRSAVSYAGTTVNTCPGLIMDGLHIHNIINPSNANNIGGVILSTGPTGAIIQNSKIHDVFTAGQARNLHGNSSAYHDWADGTIVRNCTLFDCNNICYQKVQSQNPPPEGLQFYQNYVYANVGVGLVFAGYDNAGGGSPPFSTWNVNNNVIENCQQLYFDENTIAGLQCSVNFFNNTIYAPAALGAVQGMALIFTAAAVSAGCKAQHYNNIWHVTPDTSAWGILLGGPAAGNWGGTFDRNLYPSSSAACFAVWTSIQNRSGLTLVNLAAWRGVTGTPDVNSIVGAPTYIGGTPVLQGGAAQYQLTGGSLGKGTGVGGADMGAWAGVSSIGAGF